MKQFEFIETRLPGVIEIYPTVHGDSRGYFMETYQKDLFAAAGIDKEFVQDNESMSSRGVLRGLHFQKNHPQGKLIRVTKGSVFDVAVDCRPNSPTFGKWTGVILDETKKNLFYVPEGFAHGFLVLSDYAEFVYKCTDIYDPASEGGILWNDPTIGIAWPELDIPYKTSDKDKKQLSFSEQSFSWFEQY
ncbi:MAG: dTDP-4-dehydrorhamnose 3,5-epimerase [Solobacterium sp.]|nr:dTDP-4-dehydrorhamnose 3,5-epimerase [Solobacterium sp.]